MQLYTRTNVLRSFAVAVVISGLVLVYPVRRSKYELANDGATVAILTPFQYTEKYSHQFRTALREYQYRMYMPSESFGHCGKIESSTKVGLIERPFHEAFTDNVNCLTEKAVKNSMEFFVLYLKDSSLNTKDFDQIQHSVRKLKIQTVANVGVVVVENRNVNSSEPRFVTVHKTHMEMFHQFFPGHLGMKSALQWIKNVYQPYHTCTSILGTNRSYDSEEISVPFQLSNTYKDRDIIKDRNKVDDFIITKHPASIISYSLFGSNARYTDGVIANSKLFQTIYPGWKLWIYHDDTVPLNILSNVCKVKDVTCINMTKSLFKNRMSWRFLVASVPFVSRYIIRDFDSRLSNREKAAVDEWIVSGKKFHLMRDHPSHGYLPISGGMWGGTRDAIPQMEQLLKRYTIQDEYMKDMDFLNDTVWKIAQTSVIQHDSYHCNKFEGGQPFPTKRVNLEFVGSVYLHGVRQGTHLINITKSPKECVLD